MNTAQSECGKIKTLFLKTASASFLTDRRIEEQWKCLGFRDKPDRRKAILEYEALEGLLVPCAEQIMYFPPDDTLTMDSIYCRDASIATDHGMIICNMGKTARTREPYAQQKEFEKNNIPVLGKIEGLGTVEGGDTLWLDVHTLAVGHSYRTNSEGILQLRDMLAPLGVRLLIAHLPHYKGPSDVFHLMSIISPLDHNLAVVYAPLMPINFRNALLEKNYTLIEVPDDEFDTMGCNILALAPRKCLMLAGNPKTKRMLLEAGCEVLEYDGVEISVKGSGGPTCLTRPVLREAV